MGVLKLVHTTRSNEDIGDTLGDDCNISIYSELRDITDLDDLLTKGVYYCVMLYEDRPNSGHWAALSKYNSIDEHFDSYGARPDNTLEWVNAKPRIMMRQATRYLTNILTS